MSKLIMPILTCLLVVGCSSNTTTTTPVAPATTTTTPSLGSTIKSDLNKAMAALQEAGCVASTAATIATPIVAVASDAAGNKIVQQVDAAGNVLCSAPAPTTLLSDVGTILKAVEATQ